MCVLWEDDNEQPIPYQDVVLSVPYFLRLLTLLKIYF